MVDERHGSTLTIVTRVVREPAPGTAARRAAGRHRDARPARWSVRPAAPTGLRRPPPGCPARTGEQRDAEPGRDEASHGVGLLSLEGDLRLEAGRGAQLVGDGAEAVAGFEEHELLVLEVLDGGAGPAREAVGRRNGQEDLLLGEHGGVEQRVVDGRGCEQREVEFAAGQPVDHVLTRPLDQGEPDAGMIRAIAAEERGDQRPAEQMQEAEDDVPGFGVDLFTGLADSGVDGGERALGGVGQQLGGPGEPDAATVGDRERGAEGLAERRDPAAYRGLWDAEQFGRACDVRRAAECGEQRELGASWAVILSFSTVSIVADERIRRIV